MFVVRARFGEWLDGGAVLMLASVIPCLLCVAGALAWPLVGLPQATPSIQAASPKVFDAVSPVEVPYRVTVNDDATPDALFPLALPMPVSAACVVQDAVPVFVVLSSASSTTGGDGPYCTDDSTCPNGRTIPMAGRAFAMASSGSTSLSCRGVDAGVGYPSAAGIVGGGGGGGGLPSDEVCALVGGIGDPGCPMAGQIVSTPSDAAPAYSWQGFTDAGLSLDTLGDLFLMLPGAGQLSFSAADGTQLTSEDGAHLFLTADVELESDLGALVSLGQDVEISGVDVLTTASGAYDVDGPGSSGFSLASGTASIFTGGTGPRLDFTDTGVDLVDITAAQSALFRLVFGTGVDWNFFHNGLQGPTGSTSTPTYSFLTDTDAGMLSGGSSSVIIQTSSSSTNRMTLGTGILTVPQTLQVGSSLGVLQLGGGLQVSDVGSTNTITAFDALSMTTVTDTMTIDSGGAMTLRSDATMSISTTDAGSDISATAVDDMTLEAAGGDVAIIAAGLVSILAGAASNAFQADGDVRLTGVTSGTAPVLQGTRIISSGAVLGSLPTCDAANEAAEVYVRGTDIDKTGTVNPDLDYDKCICGRYHGAFVWGSSLIAETACGVATAP